MNNHRDRRDSRRAIVGIVFCAVVLIFIAAAIMTLRYYPVRHTAIIERYSEQYGLEPALVFALINAESRFNDRAVSNVGASGLMQIMEDTANWIAPMAGLDDFDYSQIFDPEVNIRLGCYYIKMYYDRFGDMNTALCAYNAGGGRVESWLADPAYSSDGRVLDVIPFPETRNYVERVNDYKDVYRFLLRFTRFGG